MTHALEVRTLVLTALLSAAGAARADRAAVILQGGDSHFPRPVREDALSAVGGALREAGLDLMSSAEAARRLAGAACNGPACAEASRRRLGVDLLATVTLWAGGSDRTVPATVMVSLVSDGDAFRGDAEVQAGALRDALAVALAMARSRQAMGRGPWLRVEGEPRGAVVVVDGTSKGVIPYEGRVEPGSRSVLVRLTGFVSEEHTVDVPESAGEPVVLEVHLDRAAAPPYVPPRPPHPTHSAPHPPPSTITSRPIVGPLLFGVAGLAGLGLAGYGLLAGDDCDRQALSGRCLAGDRTATLPTLIYGLAGFAAIGVAVLWYALGGEPAGQQHARLGAGDLSFNGAF